MSACYKFEPPAIVAADFSSQNSEKVHCSSALARHLGLISGVIMSDIWYWTSRNLVKWDGWFYRSQEEWQEKTGLSDDSITRRLNSLEKAGYIESKRGKHPEATSPKQWVKFYRATQPFNDLYSKVLTTEGLEDKTAECGNDGEENRRMRGSSGDKTAECGDLQGTKPQNAVMISPKPLLSQDYSPPQGSIDQGNVDQEIPPTPKGECAGAIAETATKPIDVDVLISEFNDEFWPLAYKKVSIAAARKAYISARTGSKKAKRPPVDKETILTGWKVANEVLFPKEDERKKAESERFGSAYAPKQFIPMPATWLNQERWANEDVRALLDAPRVDRPKSEILRSIGIELKRLGLTGALNWNWQKRTGKTLVSQLDGEAAIAYLAELESMNSADEFAS